MALGLGADMLPECHGFFHSPMTLIHPPKLNLVPFSVLIFVENPFVTILLSEMKKGKCPFADGTASIIMRNQCIRWSLLIGA